VILGRRNGVGVGHDVRGSCGGGGPGGTNRGPFVYSLILWADAHGLGLVTQLRRVGGCALGFKNLLVLPHFHTRKMIWSTALLQHLKAHVARILAARVTVLLEKSGGLPLR